MTKNLLFTLLALGLFSPLARAEHLVLAGILGNSGEQGKTLVQFGPKPASGLGVVYDKYGTLWDRGGSGTLNRYALDGRLIATYPIDTVEFNSDKITQVGDTIILLLNKKLYTLSVDAPSGTAPTPLGVDADAISFGTIGTKIAILQNNSISILDFTAKTILPILTTPLPEAAAGSPNANVRDFDLKPDGSVLASYDGKTVRLFKEGHEVTDGWPRPSPGVRIQWIDHFWYGQFGHGTIRRFNADMEATPGVVLGGGSGSFIGHVDENDELDATGRGLAKIDDSTMAISGPFGVVQLLHWNEPKQQYEVVRRIGAVQSCKGIALNKQGDLWVKGGSWKWTDRPGTPRQNGTPIADIGQVSMLPNDTFSCACSRNGTNVFAGTFTWHIDLSQLTDLPKDLLQGSAIYKNADKHTNLLLINDQGLAYLFQIDTSGRFQKELGKVDLHTAPVVKKWTSLGMADEDTLMAAGDGAVLEMKRSGLGWTDGKRWNGWGSNDAASKFGPEIYLSTDSNHLWVSDTKRHRVLCFSLDTGEPIATFGEVDKPGNDLTHLQEPQVIIGRGDRAALYDSGNQRIVKLELTN